MHPLIKNWRRGSESNRRIELLQSPALPLGYPAIIKDTANSIQSLKKSIWEIKIISIPQMISRIIKMGTPPRSSPRKVFAFLARRSSRGVRFFFSLFLMHTLLQLLQIEPAGISRRCFVMIRAHLAPLNFYNKKPAFLFGEPVFLGTFLWWFLEDRALLGGIGFTSAE
jgi:hypothetical protein